MDQGRQDALRSKSRLPLTLIRNKRWSIPDPPLAEVRRQIPEKPGTAAIPDRYLPGPNGPVGEFLAEVKATKHGRETVDKQLCQVYSYTEPTTAASCRLWVGVKSGKPVRLTLLGVKNEGRYRSRPATPVRTGRKDKRLHCSIFRRGMRSGPCPPEALGDGQSRRTNIRKSG